MAIFAIDFWGKNNKWRKLQKVMAKIGSADGENGNFSSIFANHHGKNLEKNTKLNGEWLPLMFDIRGTYYLPQCSVSAFGSLE